MMKIYKIVILVFACTILNLQKVDAQLSDTLRITKTGEITLKDANKINVNPQLEDTVYVIPQFEYKINETKLPTPFKVDPITPAKLVGEPLDKLYNNYVSMGMDNYISPYFEYFHNKQRSKDVLFGVHIKHFSSSGKIKDYAYPGFSNNLAEINFSKIWQKSMLETKASYNRNSLHFYGFKPGDYQTLQAIDKKDYEQFYHLANVNAVWHSRVQPKSKFEYLIGLDYNLLRDRFKATEQQITTKFEAFYELELIKSMEKQKLGLEGDVRFFINQYDTAAKQNNFMVTIGPAYKFKYSAITGTIGLNAEVFNDSATLMEFFPNLNFKIEAIDKILFFNLGLKGGTVRNNLFQLSSVNPFIGENLKLDFSKNALALKFGTSISISQAINVDAQLFFDKWEHAPFFVVDTNSTYQNKFSVIYDNYELFHLKAGISYKKNERFKILLEANYYGYNMENELYAWHKPVFDAKLLGHYNIQDKFILRAEIITRGKSWAADYSDSLVKGREIKPWIDGNLCLEYRYNKKLGFFLNINNIAATRYSEWYDYPSFRFNVLAGFSFIF